MNQPPPVDLPGSGGSQPSGDGFPTRSPDSTVPPQQPAAPVEEEGPPTAPPPEFPLTPPTGDELDALDGLLSEKASPSSTSGVVAERISSCWRPKE
jgi:hypothetical protein